MTTYQDFWKSLLEQMPEAAYYSYGADWARTPNQQKWLQGQYGDIWNQYLGALGSQMRQGQSPNMPWTDFLQNLPFSERFGNLSPEQQGKDYSKFAPPLRWLM